MGRKLSNKVCVSNKTEDLNLSLFNMNTGINESKILTKHIPCKIKCMFDGKKKFNSDVNVDMNVKNTIYMKKITFSKYYG